MIRLFQNEHNEVVVMVVQSKLDREGQDFVLKGTRLALVMDGQPELFQEFMALVGDGQLPIEQCLAEAVQLFVTAHASIT